MQLSGRLQEFGAKVHACGRLIHKGLVLSSLRLLVLCGRSISEGLHRLPFAGGAYEDLASPLGLLFQLLKPEALLPDFFGQPIVTCVLLYL